MLRGRRVPPCPRPTVPRGASHGPSPDSSVGYALCPSPDGLFRVLQAGVGAGSRQQQSDQVCSLILRERDMGYDCPALPCPALALPCRRSVT